MRRAFVLIAAILAACGGGPGAVPIGAPSTPAVWPLRGTPAPNADAIHNRPLVIKVANDPAARPQSGMSQADLVLEIPVEGGITRYALVFQSEDPAKVGPVRSARQSDLNYLPALHAILAHVGASESVTQMVRDAAKSGSFVDIDEFQHADAFERVAGKVAPYNAYTSGEKIRAAAGDAGRARVDVPAMQFDASVGKAAGKDATSLVVPYTGAGKVSYAFGAASGPPRPARPKRARSMKPKITPTAPPTAAETTSAIGATNSAGKRMPEATCPGRVFETAAKRATMPRIARNAIPFLEPHRRVRRTYPSRSWAEPMRSRPASAFEVVK